MCLLKRDLLIFFLKLLNFVLSDREVVKRFFKVFQEICGVLELFLICDSDSNDKLILDNGYLFIYE